MTIELFDKAKQAAQRAVDLDSEGNHKNAVTYYLRAARLFERLMDLEKNPARKNAFLEAALEYADRAEELVDNTESESKSSEDDSEKDDDPIRKQIMQTVLDSDNKVQWEDVAGLEDAKKAMFDAIIFPIERPDIFSADSPIKPWKGVLLYGPPGCGKTYIAKAIANKAKATFFAASAADLLSKWLGESQKLVKTLYNVAEDKAPSIIFLDEVDSLVSDRSSGGSNESMLQVKTQFLQSIQGVGTEDKIVLTIGATNIPWALDKAMRRRFEKKVYIGLPDEEARRVLFRIHTKGKIQKDVDFAELAKLTVGYSGSDISVVCKESFLIPLREYQPEDLIKDKSLKPRLPNREDFLKALMRIKPSVAFEDLKRFEDWAKSFGGDE